MSDEEAEADRTPDKPAGTEQHPQGENPARQGPSDGAEIQREDAPDAPPPSSAEPAAEAGPGRPGISNPRR
jgi:hypothetical protein